MKVLVLISTYNGEKYLTEQIESVLRQVDCEVHILARDDGSVDNTISILKKYEKTNKLDWFSGKNLKPALSFMELIDKAPENYDYYAFCDQDDVWYQNKLKKSVVNIDRDIPSMFCSNAYLSDSELNIVRPVYKSEPRFTLEDVLLHGGILGCTMVFNKRLLCYAKQREKDFIIPMHDYYIATLCLALNGSLTYSDECLMFYRQHGNNVIGCSKSIFSSIKEKIDITLNNKRLYNVEELAHHLLKCFELDINHKNLLFLKKCSNYKASIFRRIRLSLDKNIGCGRFGLSIAIRLGIVFGRL